MKTILTIIISLLTGSTNYRWHRVSICAFVVFLSLASNAQPTQPINYQATLRDASGQALANQNIEIDLAILQGNASGKVIFSETQKVTSDNAGLVNLNIGTQSPTAFQSIDWGNSPYFLQVSAGGKIIDTRRIQLSNESLKSAEINNPNDENRLPVQQKMSQASKTEVLNSDEINEPQRDEAEETGGIVSARFIDQQNQGFFVNPAATSNMQNVNIEGDLIVSGISILGDITGDLVPENDGIQSLGNATHGWDTLFLSSVIDYDSDLTFSSGGTEKVAITNSGQVKITGGNPGVNKVLTSNADGLASWENISGNETAFNGWDKDVSDDFDGQYSSLTGTPQNISAFNNDAGYITSPNDADSDPTNELELPSQAGNAGKYLTTDGNNTSWANVSATNTSLTLGTSNGLSLNGQELSLETASTSKAGALSSSDKSKLNKIASAGTTASGDYSTAMGYETSASGFCSTAMGHGATASGYLSTAIGHLTTASGFASTAMGYGTTASGDYSTAMGMFFEADKAGSFVIGDGSTSTVMKAGYENIIKMRFAGGYTFYTNSSCSSGVYLSPGGWSWLVVSDSTKKENYLPVDGEYFLNSISKLKLGSWNYKVQEKEQRHYGPMAQEIFHYFGKDQYGTIGCDTTLASADLDGIMMIALQALGKRTKNNIEEIGQLRAHNEELKQTIENLQIENTEIKQRLLKLEAIVQTLSKSD